MGIQGLLPLLKSIMLPVHIKDLKDCSVAVDTYSWLHKGALSCSRELCKGIPTSKHINYCMHRVNLLRHYGVNPILVFDGGLLPMKSEQENKRARSRKENLSRAMEHESNGNFAAAYECYQKAVDISPSVAYELIQVLKQEKICYIVAPYEADAEMTFLALSKQVDAVITEDSDLIAFGCPRVIYKMDKFGQGVEYRYSMLQQNKELSFIGFTQQMMLEMCILSGCDYLQSLPGMGLKKAHALIKNFKHYEKVLKHLKYNGVTVPPLYEESFKKAVLTFRHQRVYDPVTQGIVHLSELPTADDDGNCEFLGPSIPQHLAKGIAEGELDPFTKMPFKDEGDRGQLTVDETYLLRNFKPEGGKKRIDLPVQKNLLTNYFCTASIEAKREFRVPRRSPEQLCLGKDIFGSETGANTGANPSESNNSATKLELVGCRAATKVFEIMESCNTGIDEKQVFEEKIRNHETLQESIHKSDTELHKDNGLIPGLSKVRAEKPSKIVRSSYFMRKTSKEYYDSKENHRDCTNSCQTTNSSYECRSSMDDNQKKPSTADKNVIVRSSYFQSKAMNGGVQKDENEMFLQQETDGPQHDCMFGVEQVDREIMANTERNRKWEDSCGKTLGRKENKERKIEKFSGELGIVTDVEECSVPEASLLTRDCIGLATKKRKVTFVDNAEAEDSRLNGLLTDENSPLESDNSGNVGGTEAETAGSDGKFGSDISHLGRYSKIAENSMENFVSVISSFRFTSSGSRPSGLRPPLKDVKNTRINRSTSTSSKKDISEFAYAPKAKTSFERGV